VQKFSNRKKYFDWHSNTFSFVFYDLLLYLLRLILLWYNIGSGDIVSFYMKIRLVRQHRSYIVLVYINVRQSDLTLIPPFLVGQNNFYEEKKKFSKDSNHVLFGYTLQVSPLRHFLFYWNIVASKFDIPYKNIFLKPQTP